MINLWFMDEAFDTDNIESIAMGTPGSITIYTKNGGMYSFCYYGQNQEKGIYEYNELMKMYNEAVEMRKKGFEPISPWLDWDKKQSVEEITFKKREFVAIKRDKLEKNDKNKIVNETYQATMFD